MNNIENNNNKKCQYYSLDSLYWKGKIVAPFNFNTDSNYRKIFHGYIFLTFIHMFKGTIHLYKNVDGKEEEIKKEFDNEKEFNVFVEKNPELKKLQNLKWESIKWPALSNFKDFFDNTKRFGDTSFVKELEKDFERMEKEMKSLFDRSKKFLTK